MAIKFLEPIALNGTNGWIIDCSRVSDGSKVPRTAYSATRRGTPQ